MLETTHPIERYRFHILIGIILFSVATRIVTAEYLDIGGDNAYRWMYAKFLAEGVPIVHWYQQTARWAILFPLAGLIKIFGHNPVVTYILPIFFSTLTALLICLIGERLHSLRLGVSTALITILFPQMAQTGSQLWPGVFNLAYLTLCVWLILVWLDKGAIVFLILAAISFFLGWGARVTMAYSYPGLALLIWLPRKDFKSLCIFSFTLGGLCLVEWGMFWHYTGISMGRLGVVTSSLARYDEFNTTFADYLLNITKLTKLKGLLPIWILCMAASIYTTFSSDMRWRATAWLYIIHATLLVYMIASVHPFRLAIPVGTRFWGAIAPLGLLILFKTLFDLKSKSPRATKALIAIIFLAFTMFTIKKIPPVNSIFQMDRDYVLLSPILKNRQPVLMRYETWQPNLIEEYVISAVTGKKGKRVAREDHVLAATDRNHDRMVTLFVNDVHIHQDYFEKERLTRLDYTVFKFTPTGVEESAKPAAEIVYGRKLHKVIPLP